jgi:hypothetical protein
MLWGDSIMHAGQTTCSSRLQQIKGKQSRPLRNVLTSLPAQYTIEFHNTRHFCSMHTSAQHPE